MKRRITLSIALVLSSVLVSLMISDTGFVTPGAVIAQRSVTPTPALTPATPTPCDMLKDKTYISFVTGKFDGNLNAASAAKFTFDNQGNGSGRSLLVYDPTTNTVERPQMFTVTCGRFDKDGVHFWALTFSTGPPNTGNAGSTKIQVYDNGAKFWGEHTYPGRSMDGWALQLPEPPPR